MVSVLDEYYNSTTVGTEEGQGRLAVIPKDTVISIAKKSGSA